MLEFAAMLSHASVPHQPIFHSIEKLKTHFDSFVEGKEATATAETLLEGFDAVLQLSEWFNLSSFEQLIILLTAALELEPNFRALMAKVQGNPRKSYATLGIALATLPDADLSVLSLQSPLHYWQLIHTESGGILTDAPIAIDRRILCYLLGQPALDRYLTDRVTPITAVEAHSLPTSYQAIAQQLIRLWSVANDHKPLPLVALAGTDAIANRTVAVTACGQLGLQLMAMPVAALPTDPSEVKQLQRHWEREAILSNTVLLLEGDITVAGDLNRVGVIALFLDTLTTPAIVSSQEAMPRLRRLWMTVDVQALSHQEQATLWRAHLGEVAAEMTDDIEVLANQFKLTPTAIQSIGTQFKLQPSVEAQTKQKQPPNRQQRLWDLCRHQARPNLDALAQRIDAAATWDDLIVPARQRQTLEDIATHLKYRAKIYQSWGFAGKGQRGLGISALFYGDSGTGKTMAAEVLSSACQLDLYRIDLSTVVSKYIGETEKNLRRIFDAADAGGAILLFDEADALFGKRSDVKDSRDRHANIEVSYLLQRMETYQGLAILTSNLKNNLDDAFLRRLRFIIPFSFPEAPARADIWKQIFPAQTPTQDLDYGKLGQLKISGGNIRNIALNAAFLAAEAAQPVSMQHIYQAAQRDYLKLEKFLTKEELSGWDVST